MSHFLFVGPATAAFRAYLDKRGHSYSRLIDRTQTKFPDKRITGRFVTDFANQDELLHAAANIHADQAIDGILTTYENSVLPAAQIASALRLPGLPVQAAEACTDKYVMRRLFSKAPEPISPDFEIVTSSEQLKAFAANHGFPLILKPANLAKSLLVTKNHSLEELIKNYRHTLDQIDDVYRRYSPHRKPALLVEEFMEGSIHSVDAFVDHNGEPHILDCIVDYQTGYDVGFDDVFHYSRLLPSTLSNSQQDRLKHVAKLGCQALGIKSSPAHIEIIMTPKGPKIVEIGARNGGYRERMHARANGIDLHGAYLSLVLGQMPNISKLRNDACAVLELFPHTPGVFRGIHNFDAVRALDSFVQINVKAKEGEAVGRAADGHKMCAMIMLHNQDTKQFERDLQFTNQEVWTETSPD